jgi:5'-nucleotidase
MDRLVNWNEVDYVLLDMDGTLLDLAFDNHFWRELVPRRYAARHDISVDEALRKLEPQFQVMQGKLEWYCLDYWSDVTQVDVAALKEEVRHLIAPLQGSVDFLRAVHETGRKIWLATNAHGRSWRLKLDHTGLKGWFDRVICAHDFGAPKEDPRFWQRVVAAHPFEPARVLFVDDSLPVLRAAREYGIGQIIAIRHPDSTQPRREIAEFKSVDRLADLLPLQ